MKSCFYFAGSSILICISFDAIIHYCFSNQKSVTRSTDGVLTVYQGSACGRFYWMAEEAKSLRLTTGMPFCIGQDGTGCYPSPFTGGVDDFALWTRALTREEVRRIYEEGRQGTALGELL